MAADQRGFTLIEIVVALAVFGLLLLGLDQGTRAGLRAWSAQGRAVALRDQLDVGDRALRLLIGGLIPPGGNEEAKFEGNEDTLELTTLLPTAVALDTRVADARFHLDARHRLMLAWTPRRHEKRFDEATPDPTETELLAGVARVRFAYQTDKGANRRWQSSWTDPTVPGLIRIHVDFMAGDPRHWPDIVIAPVRDEPNQ